VSETTEMAVRVYERKDNRNLRFKEKLSVYPVFPESISSEPVNGELFVAGPIDALHLDQYKAGVIFSFYGLLLIGSG
jgi:hypothetical protein